MFPLDYLEASVGDNITVSLKDGSIICGLLIGQDKMCNLFIRETITEIRLGALVQEYRCKATMVRGNMIKYIVLQPSISDHVKKVRDQEKKNKRNDRGGYNRGGRGGYNRGGRGGYRGGRGGYNRN